MGLLRTTANAFFFIVILATSGFTPGWVLADSLESGTIYRRTLQPGETHAFELEFGAGRIVRLDVEQEGIDLELILATSNGLSLAVDAPLDRRGVETLQWESDGERAFLQLVAREPLAAVGTYRLIAREVAPTDARTLAFGRAQTAAGREYRKGSPESRRQALDHYLEAARFGAKEADRARALYAVMVLQRLLNDNAAALALSDRVLELWRQIDETVFIAYTLNEIGLNRWLLGETEEARQAFTEAVLLHGEAEDDFGAAVAASNLCLMDLVENRLRKGLACYQRALPKLEAAHATLLAGDARTNVGRVYDVLGEVALAREQYEKVLDLKQRLGDRKGEARILNNLAAFYRQEGEIDRALEAYGRSLELFRELDEKRWQARLLGNIGFTYLVLGEPHRARIPLDEALTLRRELQDPRGTAMVLNNLSRLHREVGDMATALQQQRESLALFQKLGDARGEAVALGQLGKIQQENADLEGAARSYRAALERLQDLDDPKNRALIQLLIGGLELESGRFDQARVALEEALELARAVDYGLAVAESLATLARLEHRTGQVDQALVRVRQAAEWIDRLRTRIGPPDLRASFSSLRHGIYELWVDLLMKRHLQQPKEGWDAEALKIADRARARTLVELLRESEVDLWSGNAEIAERLRQAESRLQAKIERGLQETLEPEERSLLAEERNAILREIDRLEAEIRQRNPAAPGFFDSRPVDLTTLRRNLPVDARVLYFALGAERSFLWSLKTESIESFVLPPRERITDLARSFHLQLSTFDVADRREQEDLARQLGEMLLGPLVDWATGERLFIVADGALHFVPFSNLRLPNTSAGVEATVIDRFETLQLPSLAVLTTLRDGAAQRSQGSRAVAIFADPLFRAAGAEESAGEERIMRQGQPGSFEALPATRKEAEAIAVLAGNRDPLLAVGAEASRERILNEDLRAFRVIHLATHGFVDTQDPTLSGLALAQLDASGEPVRGFLGLRDIYRLRLDANLVVLSGCRTALGREMHGEGLMGLVRGFMYAGARQVLASLWPIEDHATARLMQAFYRAMWREGKDPAAALRQAQAEMRRLRRYRDPFYWAGFVLVGGEL